MKILVTGGAGFIGSHLSRRLLQSGHRVVIVDNLSTGRRENIPQGAEFLKLDLTQPDVCGRLPNGFDAVCHLAAQSAGAISAERPYYDLQANAGATLLLSRWCLEKGIPRFVSASSMAAYGNTEKPLVSEETPCVPASYYGASKLATEHILRLASREGLSVTIFRIFTVYGPGQDLGNLKQGMVSIFLAYLLKGVTVPVTGSFEPFRDFICVDDVVTAWQMAVERPSTPSLVYNLGSGKPTTVRELLASLKQAFALPQDYPVKELPGSATDQFGIYANISKLEKEVGWRPQIPLDEGLKVMVAWAKSLGASGG